jgi:hypothetical protein
MAKQYDHINSRIKKFIEAQKMFFVATASENSRINLSPKGMDTFRVLDEKRVIWLNLTGSGNETAAHLEADGRITMMMCAFEGAPMILRIYGKGSVIHPKHEKWSELIGLFPDLGGKRQIIDVEVEMVMTSCGMSIPLYDFKGERRELDDWAKGKGEDGIKDYWKEKNEKSIDGLPTRIEESY